MSKSKKQNNPIALELSKYESKVKEFQSYLEAKPILSIGDDSTRHKEIEVQLKMMEKLPLYLAEIKRLKEQILQAADNLGKDSISKDEILGESELSPLEQGLF